MGGMRSGVEAVEARVVRFACGRIVGRSSIVVEASFVGGLLDELGVVGVHAVAPRDAARGPRHVVGCVRAGAWCRTSLRRLARRPWAWPVGGVAAAGRSVLEGLVEPLAFGAVASVPLHPARRP